MDRPASRPPNSPAVRTAAGDLRPWLLLVALLAIAVYLNGIPGEFVFDDKLIQRDPRINGQESFWTIFVTDYWYKYIGTSADLYRPLTIASYALNRMVAGLSSPAFHVVNIALHAVVSVLVVLLTEAVLRDRRLAVVAGLLFAAHPVHTEAVTGIVGRAEVLSTLFLLLALYLQARAWTGRDRGRSVWTPLGLLAYFCALASKETAIVGPGLAALVDYVRQGCETPGSSGQPRRWDIRRTLGLVGLYVAVAAVYLLLRYSVVGRFIQKPPVRSYTLLFGQPVATRVFTALEILAVYLRLLFFPVTLSADYSYRQVPLLDAPNAVALAGALASVALIAAFVWAVRRQVSPAMFALGFFGVSYAIIANFPVPLQVLVAERLLYLPSVGFCVGVAWAGLGLAQRYAATLPGGVGRVAPAVALVVMVTLYGVRTVVRNVDWRTPEAIYAATVRDSPECHAAHFNYSAILLRQPGKSDLALHHLLKAYEIRQDYYPALVNLASVYLGRGEPAKAREFAQKGLALHPDGRQLKGVLAEAERRLGQQPPPP